MPPALPGVPPPLDPPASAPPPPPPPPPRRGDPNESNTLVGEGKGPAIGSGG